MRFNAEADAVRASISGPVWIHALRSVSVMPGATVLTVMPRSPTACANVLLSTLMAPLAME